MAFEKGDIVMCKEVASDDYIYTTFGIECYVVESNSNITRLFVSDNIPEEYWEKVERDDDEVWEIYTENFELVRKHFKSSFSKIKSLLG